MNYFGGRGIGAEGTELHAIGVQESGPPCCEVGDKCVCVCVTGIVEEEEEVV